MMTILLIVIYIAFIGLGIPDSLFGTAWPAIYQELEIPVSWANFVTMIISGGTIISSLFASRLIRRFGTEMVTAVSTIVTAAALLVFSICGNMACFCLCAIPLGLGAGAIDTALNNYVALHYKATHMNFLHCFYGIGVSVSPFLMSLALSRTSWRTGYRSAFGIQAAIALMMVLSIPLWKKVSAPSEEKEEGEMKEKGFLELIKKPDVRMACQVFWGSCGIEQTCGIWGSTFLVMVKGMTASAAALMITFYYIGMAVGRFLSGVLAVRLTSRQLVRLGQGVTLIAILILLLPTSGYFAGAGLFLVGLGNGAVFPNMLHLTPENFGKADSQSVMGVQMAAAYTGTLLLPAVFGLIAQNISATFFPYYLAVLFLVMIAGRIRLDQYVEKRQELFKGKPHHGKMGYEEG